MGFWVPDDAPPPAAASLVIALTTLRMRACVRVDTSLVSAATMLRMHARMRVCVRARCVCARVPTAKEVSGGRRGRTTRMHLEAVLVVRQALAFWSSSCACNSIMALVASVSCVT